MIRCAIYLRVSSDKQVREGDSIPAQRDALLTYINAHDDMVFAGEYLDDGISGTKSDRDELNRLLDDVRAGKIDRILITKLDRLYRSIKHYLNMMDVLDAHGVTWTAIWESYDTSTPQGRLMVNQMMSFAQFEAEQTGQRVRQVFRHKVAQGEVLAGSPPPGYRIESKHLVPGKTAASVRTAFETYSRTGSIYATMNACADLPGLPRSKPPFKRMLRNTIYIGQYRDNAEYCEPIIDKVLFNDVQNQLRMNVKTSQKHEYVFAGLVKCAECGRRLAGNTHKNSERIYFVYRCPKHFEAGRHCPNSRVLYETVLERHMLEQLRPSIEGVVLKYEVAEEKQVDHGRQKKAIEQKLSRLKELFINGMIDIDEYKHDRERLEAEMDTIPQPPPETDVEALRSLLETDVEKLYQTFTEAEKRRFWRGIVDSIRFGVDRSIEIVWRTK